MTDESRYDQDQAGKHGQHPVHAEVGYTVCDGHRNGMEKTGGRDCFSEREPSSGQDDDCPQEIVEVLFRQDASSEEKRQRDDGNNAHVAKDAFYLMTDAPQHYRHKRSKDDEILHTIQLVLHWANGHDCCAASRLEGDKEEEPDQ